MKLPWIRSSLLAVAATVVVALPTRAALLLDRSPAAYPGASRSPLLGGSYSNERATQHFADSFSLASPSILQGMDLYSHPLNAAVGDSVSVQLWADNGAGSLGMLLTEFTASISVEDSDGNNDLVRVARFHVNVSGIILQAATTYWIGLSGTSSDVGLIGLSGLGAPENGQSIRMNGDSVIAVEAFDVAMRLYGEVSQVPEGGRTSVLLGIALATLALGVRKVCADYAPLLTPSA